MAKKSLIERNKKRIKLSQIYAARRNCILEQIREAESLDEKCILHRKLQSLPRNSAPVRVGRRCFITGRPKAVYRDFGLSRHVLREMAHTGLLPGVKKSSW
uniref:Small ribosomal subunit protein uS14c n=1 Tax=Netrium digitus TaxID=43946 RepID=A0A191T573_9VIRI|nr:ribosomal protein S14 [Netrium digitus]ANI25532.1 ribosomal protein S14 [Netrium digitus]